MRAGIDRFVAAHPVVFAVVVIVVQHVVLFAAAGLLPPLSPGGFPDLGATLVNAVVAAAAFVFVAVAGWWRQVALPWRSPDRRWWVVA
ncbi:hypothetical protein, partial [Dactylosporangium matsuzakiense]|uniref:hypothetical protein n=1 Tax=Dactylosporangium matsuzakiense TaxID=53360 RepID=UPI0022F2AEE9